MKSYAFLFIILFSIMSCTKQPTENKIIKDKEQWAHKVDDTLSIKAKEGLFKGFEVDLIYSEYQNQLFVCHDIEDTIQGLTFDQWLSVIKKPKELNYWLDMKYLTNDNAIATANLLKEICQNYEIEKNIIVESYENNALKTIKKQGIPVLFWVDDMMYWEEKDTVKWIKKVTQKLEELNPDGISGSIHSFPLLSRTFPEQTVYYWNTPIYDIDTNIKETRLLAKEPNVKVILVDYDQPIGLE